MIMLLLKVEYNKVHIRVMNRIMDNLKAILS